jgi:hypothetical protein
MLEISSISTTGLESQKYTEYTEYTEYKEYKEYKGLCTWLQATLTIVT